MIFFSGLKHKANDKPISGFIPTHCTSVRIRAIQISNCIRENPLNNLKQSIWVEAATQLGWNAANLHRAMSALLLLLLLLMMILLSRFLRCGSSGRNCKERLGWAKMKWSRISWRGKNGFPAGSKSTRIAGTTTATATTTKVTTCCSWYRSIHCMLLQKLAQSCVW